MTKQQTIWEYLVISEERSSYSHDTRQTSPIPIKDEPLRSALNEHGAEGWELVSAVPTERGAGYGLRLIFKRPKEH